LLLCEIDFVTCPLHFLALKNHKHMKRTIQDVVVVDDDNKQQQQAKIQKTDIEQQYRALQEEHQQLLSELAIITKVHNDNEKNTKSMFDKLDKNNIKLFEQVQDLTEKLRRATESEEQLTQQQNQKILELRQKVVQYEQEKCDNQIAQQVETRDNILLQRYPLQINQLTKEKEQLQLSLNEKNQQLEIIQDLYLFTQSLFGVTSVYIDDSINPAYDCSFKSKTHELKFRIEAADNGHALYIPQSFHRINQSSDCWNELPDSILSKPFTIHGEKFAVFSAKILSDLWSNEIVKNDFIVL
jgi:hypothetical protein